MDDYRARFKSWKCPYRGYLTPEPAPSADGVIYITQDAQSMWDNYFEAMRLRMESDIKTDLYSEQ